MRMKYILWNYKLQILVLNTDGIIWMDTTYVKLYSNRLVPANHIDKHFPFLSAITSQLNAFNIIRYITEPRLKSLCEQVYRYHYIKYILYLTIHNNSCSNSPNVLLPIIALQKIDLARTLN